MDIWTDIKQTFRQGSVLTRLIYINLGIFVAVKLAGVLFFLFGLNSPLVYWLSVPSDMSMLFRQPWSVITYMFLHEGFLHLLFNILGLYWFGKLFLYHFEGEKLLSVYIMGGLSGALIYLLAFNTLPAFTNVNGFMLGASAAVFAILMAVAVYDPNREIHLLFIGRVQLKYLSAFYVVLSIISISASNPGGNLAHLGGAFWGWLYISQLRKGKDRGAVVVKLIGKLAEVFKPKEKMIVTHRQPPRNDIEYNRQQNIQQEEINRILDKIAESGYESLTKQEKEILFRQGK